MVVKSAVDRADEILYRLSLKRLFLFRCLSTYHIKNATNHTKEINESILRGIRDVAPILKTVHTLGPFYGLRKDFYFKQWLNNLAKIGDISVLIIFKTVPRCLISCTCLILGAAILL